MRGEPNGPVCPRKGGRLRELIAGKGLSVA